MIYSGTKNFVPKCSVHSTIPQELSNQAYYISLPCKWRTNKPLSNKQWQVFSKLAIWSFTRNYNCGLRIVCTYSCNGCVFNTNVHFFKEWISKHILIRTSRSILIRIAHVLYLAKERCLPMYYHYCTLHEGRNEKCITFFQKEKNAHILIK